MKRRVSTKVEYRKLATRGAHASEEDDSESDQEGEDSRVKPPWGSIALATFLLLAGVVLLVNGALFIAGVVTDTEGKATPMLIVGTICFIPWLIQPQNSLLRLEGQLWLLIP